MSELSVQPEDEKSGLNSLQFDYVEPARAAAASAPACIMCTKTLDAEYHEMNGQTICGDCRLKAEAEYKAARSALTMIKALIYGSGAALLGAIIYWGFVKITNIELGLMAIAVGWLVGKSIHKATGGWGGRRYQIIAVLFTYCAITFSYVPFYFEAADKNVKQEGTGTPGNKTGSGNTLPTPPEKAASEPAANPFAALGMFLVIILAAPFLAGFSNILGIAIILFGLRQAWTLSQGMALVTSGPYRLSAPTVTP